MVFMMLVLFMAMCAVQQGTQSPFLTSNSVRPEELSFFLDSFVPLLSKVGASDDWSTGLLFDTLFNA